jgi:hypothetical protein
MTTDHITDSDYYPLPEERDMVYARKNGLWLCGFNGGGFPRLSDDKTSAVRYRDDDDIRNWAASNGFALIAA